MVRVALFTYSDKGGKKWFSVFGEITESLFGEGIIENLIFESPKQQIKVSLKDNRLDNIRSGFWELFYKASPKLNERERLFFRGANNGFISGLIKYENFVD